jgi:hypothetical protein
VPIFADLLARPELLIYDLHAVSVEVSIEVGSCTLLNNNQRNFETMQLRSSFEYRDGPARDAELNPDMCVFAGW